MFTENLRVSDGNWNNALDHFTAMKNDLLVESCLVVIYHTG